MIARYVQKGENIDFRPTENVKAGTIFPFNGFVGITRLDIRAGELGALAVSGVFETPKADEAIDVGDPVYWDEANEVATKQKTDVYLGTAVYNAQASAEFVYYLLNASASAGAAASITSSAGVSGAVSIWFIISLIFYSLFLYYLFPSLVLAYQRPLLFYCNGSFLTVNCFCVSSLQFSAAFFFLPAFFILFCFPNLFTLAIKLPAHEYAVSSGCCE